MYLYYDKNGLLKEIVNPDSPHQASVDVDKILIYVEGYETIADGWAIFEASDGTKSNELPIRKSGFKEIPYNAKRDLKHFEYFKPYAFFEITVPQEILKIGGLATLSFRLVLSEGFKALDIYPFQIKNNVINDSVCIDLSQYELLLKEVSNKTNKIDFDYSTLELTTATLSNVSKLREETIYKGLFKGKPCIFVVAGKTSNSIILHTLFISHLEMGSGMYGYEIIFKENIAPIFNEYHLDRTLDYISYNGNLENILIDMTRRINNGELAVNQPWYVLTGQRSYLSIMVFARLDERIHYVIIGDHTIKIAYVFKTGEGKDVVLFVNDIQKQIFDLKERVDNIDYLRVNSMFDFDTITKPGVYHVIMNRSGFEAELQVAGTLNVSEKDDPQGIIRIYQKYREEDSPMYRSRRVLKSSVDIPHSWEEWRYGFDSNNGTTNFNSFKQFSYRKGAIVSLPYPTFETYLSLIDNNKDDPTPESTSWLNITTVLANKDKGVPNGVASLDENGKIPSSQLSTAGIFLYKGQVPTYNDLPTINNEVGDTYDVKENGKNYVWNGTGWDDLGGEQFTQEWKDKINNNTTNITEINNDLAHFSKDIVDLQLDKLDKKPISLPHGTDLYAYNWNNYENGTYFAGTDFVNIPVEMVDHKDVIIQLIKQNESGRYALVLYHTGLYEANTGLYINFHYSDKFKGWEKVLTGENIDIPKANESKLGGVKAKATTTKDTREVHIDDNGFLKVSADGAGDKARVDGENLIFEQAVDSDVVVPNNGQPTTANLETLKVGDTNYQVKATGKNWKEFGSVELVNGFGKLQYQPDSLNEYNEAIIKYYDYAEAYFYSVKIVNLPYTNNAGVWTCSGVAMLGPYPEKVALSYLVFNVNNNKGEITFDFRRIDGTTADNINNKCTVFFR